MILSEFNYKFLISISVEPLVLLLQVRADPGKDLGLAKRDILAQHLTQLACGQGDLSLLGFVQILKIDLGRALDQRFERFYHIPKRNKVDMVFSECGLCGSSVLLALGFVH